MAGWKADLLSLAGRAVLVQASITTILAYVMQCTALPKKLLDNIDRVNRNFLCRLMDDAKKNIHWVGWHKVTKSNEEGGLGIQSAKGRNQAFLAKLNWRFRVEKDALWVKVLNNKYCSNRRLNAKNWNRFPCSRTWKAMKMGGEVFNKGIRWISVRNNNLSLWRDN